MDVARQISSTPVAIPNGFSRQINDALSTLTSKFGDEINEAYVTAPATQKRAHEAEAEKLEKIQVIEQNKNSIMADMIILAAAKQMGKSASEVSLQFLGVQQLGGADYLDGDSDEDGDSDYDDVESDDESHDDDAKNDNVTIVTKAMVGEGMMRVHDKAAVSDDDSDYDDSEDDDDYDSDYDDDESDESSIGSYGAVMADMEESMGVLVPADFKVNTMLGASAMSLVSLQASGRSDNSAE